MQISDLQLVAKTAQLGSISAAAAQLDVQVAMASAAIKRVEKQLGFELFVRSTRRLRLSKQGEKYLPMCLQALSLLENARQEVLADSGEIEGELRLTAPSDLGRNILLPWLDEMLDMHPKLKLRLILNDHNLDFYRDGVDVALRYGEVDDANLYGFKICDAPLVLCAAPSYIARCGEPQDHEQLSKHNGLFFQLRGSTFSTWPMKKADKQYKVTLNGDRVGNDADLVRRWCAAGKGIALRSALDVSDQLLDGSIKAVMRDYQLEHKGLWLVCPTRQSINPSVRLLRDILRERCAKVLQGVQPLLQMP